QYNQLDGLKADFLSPFKLRVSRDRITDEHAPVTLLAPTHPVLNTPNRITSADFSGWVQERGLYFPDQWDERFTPILAASDPGEKPLQGGLLVARHGKGFLVYTSRSWFRQLPEGVPGAYRLFATLVSLGQCPRRRHPNRPGRMSHRVCPASARGVASTCSCSAGSCSW